MPQNDSLNPAPRRLTSEATQHAAGHNTHASSGKHQRWQGTHLHASSGQPVPTQLQKRIQQHSGSEGMGGSVQEGGGGGKGTCRPKSMCQTKQSGRGGKRASNGSLWRRYGTHHRPTHSKGGRGRIITNERVLSGKVLPPGGRHAPESDKIR